MTERDEYTPSLEQASDEEIQRYGDWLNERQEGGFWDE